MELNSHYIDLKDVFKEDFIELDKFTVIQSKFRKSGTLNKNNYHKYKHNGCFSMILAIIVIRKIYNIAVNKPSNKNCK